MLQTAYQSARGPRKTETEPTPDPLAVRLGLDGEYRSPEGIIPYHVQRIKLGFVMMFGAGTFSGLLGIGSGSLKVPAMDIVMRLPFKVSTATSSFMIGVTAAASAGVYLGRGQIEPNIALPVMLSVLAGSLIGARVMPLLPVRTLRLGFAVLVCFTAITMIWKGVRGV
jgi:uncharacterized membrane protein YfcA